jgi:hypothetical protein
MRYVADVLLTWNVRSLLGETACPLHVPRLNLTEKKRSNRTLKFMLDAQTPPASATTAPEKKTAPPPPPKPAPIIRNRVYHAFSEVHTCPPLVALHFRLFAFCSFFVLCSSFFAICSICTTLP